MRVAQDQTFGPVVAELVSANEDAAVAIANDSAYGLDGSVFTSELERRVARRSRNGTVQLNGRPAGLHPPMGGVKSSGIGREAGLESFEAGLELKSIGLPEAYAETLTW
jgi:acyl-CoA reductase-like NAD-dependent aldehyde dehydrogenase